MQKQNIPTVNEELLVFADAKRAPDTKLHTSQSGYLSDAWRRLRKNPASVAALIMILLIVAFALITPLVAGRQRSALMDTYYAKKGPYSQLLKGIGIADGGERRVVNERGLIRLLGTAMGESGKTGEVGLSDINDDHHTLLTPTDNIAKELKEGGGRCSVRVNTYHEVGFLYLRVSSREYDKMIQYQNSGGMRVLYPLIASNEYSPDTDDPNIWYRVDPSSKNSPISPDGNILRFSSEMKLTDNYLRNADGELIYRRYIGGDGEDAEYRVRVNYYNYYVYKNGFEPSYIFGTDAQGYDLAVRAANGIRLSLLISLSVSVINLAIGLIYGAIEGYYGGAADLLLERVSDILACIPFIVVATLFQLHLADRLGKIPSLLFAFVLTGWIPTAARTRTQFYRFKGQEYVMAARTLGARNRRIIWRHIFPNALGTIVTSSVLVIPAVILNESMLSFLGIVNLGSSDTTSLGTLLSEAAGIWTNFPHLMLVPAIFISLLMISFNLFGNGLRDALDPSQRGAEG